METIVTLQELKHHLSEWLERAACGERVAIHQRGKPALALTRVEALQTAGDPSAPSPMPTRQRLESAAVKLGARLRLAPQQQKRLTLLGHKNKQGILTEEERAELEHLLHVLEEISRQRAQALSELV